jgi:hypothetical protein
LTSFTSDPSPIFHTFTSPFQLPPATRLPSGLTATEYTQSVGPVSVFRFCPESAFHTLTVLSAPHVTSSGCFGTATSLSASPPWPPKSLISLPSPVAFHERSLVSDPTE